MPIKIYTYPDPYHLDQLSIWPQIKDAPQFCVSQTMVNGLKRIYPCFDNRQQLTTISRLVNALYSDWESLDRKVKQVRDIDNAIDLLTKDANEGLRKSLLFNAKSFAKCARLLSELGLEPDDLSGDRLKIDQRYLLDVFKIVREKDSFRFSRPLGKDAFIASMKNSLSEPGKEPSFDGMTFDTIVIHGIHQFAPSMLNAIDDFSKDFNVILLFNYQSQYKEVYETWLNIYSLFDLPIRIEQEGQFTPNSLLAYSYQSNLLADYIGKTMAGKPSNSEDLSKLEVIEFENLTEFANYVARVYQNAVTESAKVNKPPLALMSEQFYAASSKANDILRAYFPEQFGERHFLDYPFGHFFVAVLDMWDPEEGVAIVDNFSLIKECFNSGVIHEERPGELISTFNKVLPYFEDQRTLSSIISHVKTLWKNVGTYDHEKRAIGYFNVTKDELSHLLAGLNELNQIITLFFDGYAQDSQGFKTFYGKIQKFIVSKLADQQDLDDEMVPVVKELLAKLQTSSFDGSATFTCLKQTMSFYLSQNDKAGRSARWIVRGFEQIDGDILRTGDPRNNNHAQVYHFAALSDKDICTPGDARLPWPLDVEFFEKVTVPLSWKYRLYLQSKMEFKHFHMYALLYGLEFNRNKVKLSYIKTENEKDNDILFIFKLLGARIVPYKAFDTGSYNPPLAFDPKKPIPPISINVISQIKATMCPYRFVSEDLIQSRVIFKERFLVHTFMRVLIVNAVLEKLQNQRFSEAIVKKEIKNSFEVYRIKFKLENELEHAELFAAAFKDLRYYAKNKTNTFPAYSGNKYFKEELETKEIFLLADLRDILKSLIPSADIKALIEHGPYRVKPGAYCKYCASKGTCLEYRK